LEEENEMVDQETFPCQICGRQNKEKDLVSAKLIRASIVDVIIKEYPRWSPEGYICHTDLNKFRLEYVQDALEKERDEYSSLKETEKYGLKEEDHLPKNINVELEKELTLGEHLSDKIASFAGSWTFIGVFVGLIFLWVALNTYILLSRPFDPYPYILLNLVLSIITAIQAPIIIMSQNRQEMRDRLHAERDYHVSIHTELEIHRLHRKIDYLMTSQGQRLMEIQNIQVEMMNELSCKMPLWGK
jgi:uncharacterized membrane protein